MSRNFKIGTKVIVKETKETGIVKGREKIINPNDGHVKIEYIVKMGEGINNWKSFSPKQLDKITNKEFNSKTNFPQIITSQFVYNKRMFVMVGIVDKIKIDTYDKKVAQCDYGYEKGECDVYIKKQFKGKSLSIGWAILHQDDGFDVLIGEKIGIRRAKECPISVLYSEFNGEFNTDMVEEVLRNKADYIFENIEKFIK
jgi:hypothetical protein